MLEEVTSYTLTEVGAADGAGGTVLLQQEVTNIGYLSPASNVIAVRALTALLPATFVAVTVME